MTNDELLMTMRLLRLLTGALFLLILWIALLDFPRFVVGGSTLDGSWEQALGYFMAHRAQAGVDYVFTYGPLGYFDTNAYEPSLFWWKYAWEVISKGLTVLVFAALMMRLGWSRLRFVF